MSFDEIARRFAVSPSGTDLFKAFYKDAFEIMKTDVENAGLYFVVGIAAQSFVRKYEDQGLTADFVDGAKNILVSMNQKLILAMASEPATRLRMLGEVAIAYEWDVSTF